MSKSVIIFYSYTPQGIKLLIGKHSVYNDFMFIGGGRKKHESNSLCASREIFEETKSLFGSIDYLHTILSNQSFKCRPITIDRLIPKQNSILRIKLKIHVYLLRVPYIHNINNYFNQQRFVEECFNELNEMIWINLEDLPSLTHLFFSEDSQLLSLLQKESNLSKLININQRQQLENIQPSLNI